MPQRSSGTLWLVLGLLAGLASLGCCGCGGFGVYHTQSNLDMHQKALHRDLAELERPQNRAQFEQLRQRIEVEVDLVREDKNNRLLAVVIVAAGLLPGLLALVFLGIFAMKRFRSND